MRRPLPLVLVLALTAACGSTVQQTSLVGGGTGGGQLSATPGGDGTTGLAGTTGTQAVAGTTGGTSGAVGTAGGTAAAPGTTGTTGEQYFVPSLSAPSGPGVTDKVIYVGAINDKNSDAVNNAAGVGAITHGDSLANTRAVIDDINKHGGIAGRKLVMRTANFDSTSAQSLETQWAAVCQQFTKDTPVFAVIDTGTSAYHDCVGKAGVVVLSDNLVGNGDSEFQKHPGFIEQGFPSVDRLAQYMTTSLVEQKYFTPWSTVTGQPAATGAVKVGVLTYDDATYRHAVDTFLVPALKKLGYNPVVERIAPLSTASDVGAQAAAVKGAQLAFAANGVTHVISFETNGGLSTFFLPNARSQAYYPRYGVNTASGTEALIEAGVTDPQQLNGTVGFGWIPAVDLAAADYSESSPYSDANRRHCRKVMRDHGITPDSGNAEAIMLAACANLYLLQTALEGATRVSMGTFVAALEGLGTRYRAAGSFGEYFAPGRHDGVNHAYHWHYLSGCNCMRYEGSVRTIP